MSFVCRSRHEVLSYVYVCVYVWLLSEWNLSRAALANIHSTMIWRHYLESKCDQKGFFSIKTRHKKMKMK